MMKAIAGSMRALVYVILLMCLFFYHFAIAGVFLFSKNDPYHFGNILKSFVTLFQVS
jgi:voltage-gated sodium channel